MQQYFLCLIATLWISATISAQCDRWQLAVDYSIETDFDTQKDQYTGQQQIKLYNNSPDTLRELYFHLYYNAFQPGSSMDIRSRTIADPDRRVADRIVGLDSNQIGFMIINKINVNGKIHSVIEHETIANVPLLKAILPGETALISIEFVAQVPDQIRRAGKNSAEGIHYSMAQWYPKLCNYDETGWHPTPYLGREFYGIFGNFSCSITIDSNYTLAGTGVLANAKEIGKGYAQKTKKNKAEKHGKLTWVFEASNVHDFMWAADPHYRHITFDTPDSITIRAFYVSSERTDSVWPMLPEIMSEAFGYIQKKFGRYPYTTYSFIQGGDGGMEYPMSTLITGNRNLASLVGVSVHELMHSWYHGVLGFNESLYHWMDEGFTSFASELVMDHLRQKGMVPQSERNATLFRSSYIGYKNLVESGVEEPMGTHADHFNYSTAYGMAAYSKGNLYLQQLRYILGEDLFWQLLLEFYDRCAYKHPTDADFIRIAETISGMQLKWYNEYWVHSTKTIDYAISQVNALESSKTLVSFQRIRQMPMPLDVMVDLADGSKFLFHIPLDLTFKQKTFRKQSYDIYTANPWKWVAPDYEIELPVPLDQIARITIDPFDQMADIDRSNNVWQAQ